jgi:hypothetical protein
MSKSSNIARGGLLTALGVIFIYLSNIAPTSKIYLLGVASCIIPLSIMWTNIKNSIVVYGATCILCLLLIGFKGGVATYILFFGLYGFAKFYIEKLRKLPLEILLKLVFFNISIALIFLIYKVLFAGLLKINISIPLAIVMFQFVFLIYDYALTLFISYVSKHYIKS